LLDALLLAFQGFLAQLLVPFLPVGKLLRLGLGLGPDRLHLFGRLGLGLGPGRLHLFGRLGLGLLLGGFHPGGLRHRRHRPGLLHRLLNRVFLAINLRVQHPVFHLPLAGQVFQLVVGLPLLHLLGVHFLFLQFIRAALGLDLAQDKEQSQNRHQKDYAGFAMPHVLFSFEELINFYRYFVENAELLGQGSANRQSGQP
jgi:hypothetical protein